MKDILKLLLMAAAAATFAACEQTPQGTDPEEPEVELNQDLAFTLEVESVEADQAKVKVSHNGTADDTWYGFVTKETAKDDGALISAEVERLLAAGKVSGLKNQTSTTVTLRGLDPETDYKYITFGLTEKGEVYGVYESVKFKTTRDASKLEETDDWKISYQRGENQGQIAELFSIQCEDGKGFYFTTIDTYSLEVNEMTALDYVSYVITTEIPMMLEYGYKWNELYIPESYTLASPRMVSGDYIALAIGFDSKGNSTGYYSVQEFTVEEETATADYTQWLGTWNITDEYEYEDEKTGEIISEEATYTVTIHHYDNNYMYAMTGWEENGDISNDIREYVGDYIVPLYYNDGRLEFVETTLDYVELEGYGEYAFGFYGIGNLTMQGQLYEGTLIGMDNLTMAEAETADGGQTGVISGTKQKIEQYEIEYTGMFYCGYPTSGQGNLAYWNLPMEFPLTMEKQAAEAAVKSAMEMPSLKNTDLKKKSMDKLRKRSFTPMYVR